MHFTSHHFRGLKPTATVIGRYATHTFMLCRPNFREEPEIGLNQRNFVRRWILPAPDRVNWHHAGRPDRGVQSTQHTQYGCKHPTEKQQPDTCI